VKNVREDEFDDKEQKTAKIKEFNKNPIKFCGYVGSKKFNWILLFIKSKEFFNLLICH